MGVWTGATSVGKRRTGHSIRAWGVRSTGCRQEGLEPAWDQPAHCWVTQPASTFLSATFSELSWSPIPLAESEQLSGFQLYLLYPLQVMHPALTASKPLTHQQANAGPWSLPVLPCFSSGSGSRSPTKKMGCTPHWVLCMDPFPNTNSK